jgi:hypothetical protein
MSEPDELEVRVTRLEQQMIDVRQDATAARVLAGGADRDVSEMRSELRGHTQVLNALRKTQLEQGKAISEQGKAISVQGKAMSAQGKAIGALAEATSSLEEATSSLREIQIEHGREMRNGFSVMNQGFTLIEDKFRTVHAGIAQITALLTSEPDEN